MSLVYLCVLPHMWVETLCTPRCACVCMSGFVCMHIACVIFQRFLAVPISFKASSLFIESYDARDLANAPSVSQRSHLQQTKNKSLVTCALREALSVCTSLQFFLSFMSVQLSFRSLSLSFNLPLRLSCISRHPVSRSSSSWSSHIALGRKCCN